MGRIVAPYGLRGWAKVQTFTSVPDSLLNYGEWWLPAGDGDWKPVRVESAKVHGQVVLAKLEELGTPEQVVALGKVDVAVPRKALPPAADGEYYWADLVGMAVVNLAGESLGTVDSLMDNGAQSILVVRGERERLIPFVESIVRRVDTGSRAIVVDWGADY
ncbi:MAG: ribosome maturation factor RimM [Betaproteobacteria bacterium]|jgi:16S rRNA processing protein RimM